MRMPPKSPDMEAGKDRVHNDIGLTCKAMLDMVDVIATSGFADRRWCAIARTHIEEGEMALHRALRDYPGDDPNQYGKQPHTHPLPKSFTPPTGGDRDMTSPGIGSIESPRKTIEWSDYDADGNLKPPDKPE